MKENAYIYIARGTSETMMGNMDLVSAVVHISRQMQILYSKLKEADPVAAEEFRNAMTTLVNNEDSPVWESDVHAGPGGVDAFEVNKEGPQDARTE